MANSVIPNCGITHVALRAADFERSLEFYKAIGFTVFRQWGTPESRIALLDSGDGTLIELFSKIQPGEPNGDAAGGYSHVAFHVDDVDAAFQRALNAGAKPKIEPKFVDIASEPMLPVRLAFVYGPSGEQLEFFHILK